MIKATLRPGRALIAPLALLGLSLAGASHADQISFNFATSTFNGHLGVTQNFASNEDPTVKLTANGYVKPGGSGNTADLYAKWSGSLTSSETGLGLYNGSDNEIDGNHFIELDMNDLLLHNPAYGYLKMGIGSIQKNEQYHIYGKKTSDGTLSGAIDLADGVGSGSLDTASVSLADYHYIYITGGGPNTNGGTGDVLILNNLIASTLPIPEPAFYQMGVFLAGGGLMALRLRRKNRQ